MQQKRRQPNVACVACLDLDLDKLKKRELGEKETIEGM